MSAWYAWDNIGLCQRCGQWIKVGQPYAPMVTFVGSWGGFMHAYCPLRLVVSTGISTTGATS